MARSFNGSSDVLSNANAVLTATPITMAAWCIADSASGLHPIMTIQQSGSNNQMHRLKLYLNKVHVQTQNSNDGSAEAAASTTYSTGTWFHAAGVFASSTSRIAYFNGGNSGSNTTNITPSPLQITQIGKASGPDEFYDGTIAEAGIWNVALDADEIAALGKGVSPLLIRPGSLAAYWPLIGRTSPEICVKGDFPMTVTGAATADHPRIYYPRRRDIMTVPASAPAGLAANPLYGGGAAANPLWGYVA